MLGFRPLASAPLTSGSGAPGVLTVTDRDILQLPVNCVLAGQQPYKFSWREKAIPPRNTIEKTWGRHSSTRRLKGAKPSFTITTNNRGYD